MYETKCSVVCSFSRCLYEYAFLVYLLHFCLVYLTVGKTTCLNILFYSVDSVFLTRRFVMLSLYILQLFYAAFMFHGCDAQLLTKFSKWFLSLIYLFVLCNSGACIIQDFPLWTKSKVCVLFIACIVRNESLGCYWHEVLCNHWQESVTKSSLQSIQLINLSYRFDRLTSEYIMN